MNKNILFVAALAATLSLGACDTAKKTAEEAQAEAAEIEAAAAEEIAEVKQDVTGVAEFVGTYEGTIAQADGSGFATVLVLNADNTYSLTQTAEGAEAMTQTGSFVYTEEGNLLTLTSTDNVATKFNFQGDKVVMLTIDGAMPENPEVYTLLKKVM